MSQFEKELLKRLDSYKSANLIDAASEKKLREALQDKICEESRITRNLLYILGIILVFTACCIWVYHNWEYFHERVREALAFAPLAISAVLGIFAIKKDFPQFWKEASAMLNIAGVWVMITSIGHLYNIQPDTAHFCLSVICLSFLTVPIFRSGSAIVALCILNIFYAANCPESEFIVAVAIYAALAAFAYKFRDGNGVLRNIVLVFVCMVSAVSISCVAAHNILSIVLVAGFSGIFLAASASKKFSGTGIFNNPYAGAGFFLLIFLMSVGASKGIINHLINHTAISAFFPAFWTLCAVYAFSLFRAFRNPRRENAAICLSIVFPAFATVLLLKNFWAVTAVLNGAIFASSAAFLISGILKKKLIMSNVGAILILFQCVSRIFDSQTDVGIRAVAIAAVGVLLAILNMILNRKISREN